MRSGAESHEKSTPAAFFFRPRFFRAWTAKSGEKGLCVEVSGTSFWEVLGSEIGFGRCRFRAPFSDAVKWRKVPLPKSFLDLILGGFGSETAPVAGKGANARK